MSIESRREFLKASVLAAGAVTGTGAALGAGLGGSGARTAGGALRGIAGSDTGAEHSAPPPSRSFLDAVVAGDRTAVGRWLSTDPGLVHARDAEGRSAFAIALLAGHREIGELLVAAGHKSDLHEAALAQDWERLDELATQAPAAVNQDHPIGGTAMYAAAAGGAGTDLWRVYRYAGDPNAAPRGELGYTALRAALEYEDLTTAEMSAATLLSNGADPNLPQPDGRSPLHVAAARGSVELVEYLVKKGADTAAVDEKGRTPRQAADLAGRQATERMLANTSAIPLDCRTSRAAYDANGAPYVAPDLSAFAALERERVVGASHRMLDVVRASVERHPELAHAVATTTERAVEAGAHMGNTPIVDYLLDQGAPYSLPTAMMRNDLARAKALLDEDRDRIHERGAHDFALLWYSVIGDGSLEGAELLLSYGVEIEDSHYLGTTALHWAAMRGKTDMIELFLDHGADIDRRGRKFSAQGQTPLELAESRDRPEAVALLKSRGAR